MKAVACVTRRWILFPRKELKADIWALQLKIIELVVIGEKNWSMLLYIIAALFRFSFPLLVDHSTFIDVLLIAFEWKRHSGELKH